MADLVVVVREQPSFEMAYFLGAFLKSEFVDKGKIVGGPPECIPRPYGFDFSHQGACLRVAFAVHRPGAVGKIEPGVHSNLIWRILLD